jgi:predicted site-specific integrase-resolvase
MAVTRVMTTAEVADRMGVSFKTAERYADDGTLNPIRRKPLLYDADEVDKLAAETAIQLRARLAKLEIADVAS